MIGRDRLLDKDVEPRARDAMCPQGCDERVLVDQTPT